MIKVKVNKNDLPASLTRHIPSPTWDNMPHFIELEAEPIEEPNAHKGAPCHDGVNYHELCAFQGCVCLCHRPEESKQIELHPRVRDYFRHIANTSGPSFMEELVSAVNRLTRN